MTGDRRRSIGQRAAGAILAILSLVYIAFGAKYENPNWILSPPNVIHFEGREYQPSNFDPFDTPPPRPDYTYEQISSLSPFRQAIYGLKDVPLQMSLYLEWHGNFEAYGILGGP